MSKKNIAYFSLLTAAVMLTSCEKDVLTGQPEWLGNSIYERLEEGIEVNGQKRTFNMTLHLIDDLGQKEVLSKTGSKTLFVTSDDDYAKWFANNDWGVRSYEDLSLAQKKMLFNNSMINNAYLLELMSNVSGNPPQKGLCMRRPSAASIFDSIPTMQVEEMPVDPMLQGHLDGWAKHVANGKPIRILKNDAAAPMIHFLPEFMRNNNITDDDLYIISNGESTSISDSWINGKKVVSEDQTCKNGYIYVVDGVIESSQNMAEIIRTTPEMSTWSSMINRFSAPFVADRGTLNEFQRIYNTNDTVYVLRYYSERSMTGAVVNRTPEGYAVPARLTFDPGMNNYMWHNTMGYDMHYDAGAMIVPTNEAIDRWWNTAGKGLREEYGSWENVPVLTLSKLLNVNMLPSLVDAVPSKFGTIVDDAKKELGITKDDVVRCYMGCNGVIYLVNKVFAPSEYRSVVYPALTYQSKMSVIYYAIDNYDFGPFLNSMDSRFSLVLPYNVCDGHDAMNPEKKVLRYIDPCTYGLSNQVLFEFYWDEEEQRPMADRYSIAMNPDNSYSIVEELGPATEAQIKNRLTDLVNNLIVVGDIEDGKEYYKTKAGSVIRVQRVGGDIVLQGGYQMDLDQQVVIEGEDIYDMTENGNGKSYGVIDNVPMTASHSVFEVLKDAASKTGSTTTLFYKLLSEDETLDALLVNETTTGTKYSCANDADNKNIRLFDNYNYTVYVPSDTSVQRLIDEGYLPTWEDYQAYADDVDRGDAKARASQDSIANIIHNFIRYHIQDNSVFIGGPVANKTKYETSKLNPQNRRFYSLEVTADSNDLTVVDLMNNVRKVVKDGNLYNRVCREYWMTKSGTGSREMRSLISSSNAVVQQIDGVLIYDKSQLTNWKQHLPQ